MFPFAVSRAALTEPAEKSSLNLNAPHTAFAASINFDLASFMSFVSPNGIELSGRNPRQRVTGPLQ
jgi:hypothetical protein